MAKPLIAITRALRPMQLFAFEGVVRGVEECSCSLYPKMPGGAVRAVGHHPSWQGTTTMFKRALFNPATTRYLPLECITAAAFAVLIVIVVVGSSNEKVSALSAFSLERYLLSSTP